MAKWIDYLTDIFSKGINEKQLPAGIYTYQSPPEVQPPNKLHLRMEPDGSGMLIINASTILHLNSTAAEFAFYHIKGFSDEQVLAEVKRRYNTPPEKALEDYHGLIDRINDLITTPDLDPETFLDMESEGIYNRNSSAPFRLDCALTYKSNTEDQSIAPLSRVKRELLTEEWKMVLARAWNAGIPHIVFTGGEPTCRPDLAELIGYSQSLGQVTGLVTDGLRLSDRDYLHQLLNNGLDHMLILLDPNNEQSWEAVKDAIAEDIFVTVHLTLTPGNVDLAAQNIDRLASYSIRNLSVTASDFILEEKLKEVTNYAIKSGLSIVWDIPVPYSIFNPFRVDAEGRDLARGDGIAWCYVEPDGDVLPGQGHNLVMGNLLSDEWVKIWNNRPEA